MGFKAASGRYARFLAYVVVVVLVNVAGTTFYFRQDLTEGKVYSLSKASREVVATLSEPLTINVFFTKDLPAPYNATERYLRDLLQEYGRYANRYFTYRFYDVSAEQGSMSEEAKENQALARSYGIRPVEIRVIEKDEVKFKKAYMGLVLIHGDLMERIATVTSPEGLEYRLTTAIQKLNNKISALLRLKEKIRVKLFLSSALERVAPHVRLKEVPQLPGRMQEIVERLNRKHYGKLAFERVDPTKDPGQEKVAGKYNLLTLKWPSLPEKNIEAGEGVVGLVIEQGEKWTSIPLIHVLRLPLIGTQYQMTDLGRLEEAVSQGIESIMEINEDLGYLTDHGTLSLYGTRSRSPGRQQGEGGLDAFRTLVSQGYTIKEVELKKGAIPDSFNCLLVAGPREKFSDYELFQIDQFLMQGKSLAIFLDRFQEKEGPSNPGGQGAGIAPLDTGLEKLLEHYGVSVKTSYVMDESCYKQRLPAQFGGGERPIYFAPIIQKESINRGIGFLENIKGLVVYKVSPLDVDAGKTEEMGIQVQRLFSSSERSWEMRPPINLNPFLIHPPKDQTAMKSRPLAYLLEGSFRSYFAGKEIPESPPPEGKGGEKGEKGASGQKQGAGNVPVQQEGALIERGRPGKIFIIATSEVLKDQLLDKKGRSSNAMFLLNTLDYLNGRENVALLRSKELRFNPLEKVGARTRAFVKTFNIAGLPVLVVLFGIGVWLWRHARRRRIQTMFGT